MSLPPAKLIRAAGGQRRLILVPFVEVAFVNGEVIVRGTPELVLSLLAGWLFFLSDATFDEPNHIT
jgi:hypothetical protein